MKHVTEEREKTCAGLSEAVGRTVGLVEKFRIGEHEHVEKVLDDLAALGIRHLRTPISWADWHTPEGRAWYDWLFPTVAARAELLPCVLYTPPSIGVTPSTAAPPRVPKDYADFIDALVALYGAHFEWVELWNEPNNLSNWDWRIDPSWQAFSDMIGGAAQWAKQCDKRTVLAGTAPCDPNWLGLMCERGVMRHIDAVGIHGFPGTWEFDWTAWSEKLRQVRAVLEQHGYAPELWITETGYSTWKHNEQGQIESFAAAVTAPVDRVYWYSARDLAAEMSTESEQVDERHHHMGLRRADGTPKLLYRLLCDGGMEQVRKVLHQTGRAGVRRTPARRDDVVLITGGAGFIGCNVAHRYLSQGRPVRIFDNLSRPGSEKNLNWLWEQHPDGVDFVLGDVRSRTAVRAALDGVSEVFHFAAQVAVTTSLDAPIFDSEVNIGGTLCVLEELRRLSTPPGLVFTSTNKVYGGLEHIELRCNGDQYEPIDALVRRRGLGESTPLCFSSPYGCSKGSADQYILDYAKNYDLPATVFRMSCIYGPRQFGNEDQGWVAHFIKAALAGQPLVIYGDGRQVRDLLYIDDLVDAMQLAQRNMGALSGQACNIGGGPRNTRSLLEVIQQLETLQGKPIEVSFEDWRPADQRYYVSDTARFMQATGWRARVPVQDGIVRLYDWLAGNQGNYTYATGGA